MFALAVWSEREKRLVLARDRVGIKPLYFSHTGQQIYFASEIKSSSAMKSCQGSGSHCAWALPRHELRSWPKNSRKGNRKAASRNLLEWRNGKIRSEVLLEATARKGSSLDSRLRGRSTRSAHEGFRREHLLSDVPVASG